MKGFFIDKRIIQWYPVAEKVVISLNERIKKLRKALDLTQQAFADRLGIKQNTIAKYETNRGTPTTSVISLIVREFNVSEAWLRTGEGEMFTPSPDGALEALAREYKLSPGMYVLIKRLLALTPENQQAAVDFAVKFAEDLNKLTAPAVDTKIEINTPLPEAISSEQAEPDLAAEIAKLKHQNQALAAEIAALKEEDAGMEAAAELSAWPSVSAGSLNQTERAKK